MTQRDDILARLDRLLEEARQTGDRGLLDEIQSRIEAPTPAAPGAELEDWHGLIGSCPPLLEIRDKAQRFADARAPILIRGESGTGKDVLARILHDISPRAAQPFVGENCAAIPHNLLESVLFGHRKGSFTGAIRDHDGHFVAAHRGSLFLDEIGDMPLAMQAKLLRALQEGEVRPVGGQKVRKVDVRILAATNQDLEEMVAAGTFREDLYYRLNVLQLYLPPLRDRGEDVLMLAQRFLDQAARQAGRRLQFDEPVQKALLRAHWPGNVRQLQNEIQRVAVLAASSRVTLADLSREIGRSS